MGWSYGGVVSVESQNMFNIKALNTKNRFALHIAYYPYCYHYDDVGTTDGAMVIMKGDQDTISYSQCKEWVEKISTDHNHKKQIIFKGVTHNFDSDSIEAGGVSSVGPECRIHTDAHGNETVRPNNKDDWFDLTQNGGWFGNKGDSVALQKAKKLCWDTEQAVYTPDMDAYNESQVIFLDYVNKYLGGNNDR
jgi:hypothetical protein